MVLGLLGMAVLAGCGGGGGDSGQVRLINATLTHASINLISTSDSNTLVSNVATDSVSGYVGVGSGTPTLQINDATTGTLLVGTTPSLTNGGHLAIIAYEIDGIVQPAFIAEDTTNPTSGNAGVRIIDLAVDAGALNIYLMATGTAPTSSTTPTFQISAPSQVTATGSLLVPPGSYTVYVTGPASVSDVRLKIDTLTLSDSQNTALILSPTAGGVLVNGASLIQQGDYTATKNTNARVRVAAAVSGGATVTVKAGSTAVTTNATSPAVTPYVLVPAAGSTLSVTVNGAAVTAPTAALAAGTDSTLLVSGAAGAAAAKLIVDDNHGSLTVGDARLRMINALTGAAPNVTFKAAFSILDTAVEPISASEYFDVVGGTNIQIDALSGATATSLFSQQVTLQAGKVYTVFMFGDPSAPIGDIVQDSPN
jgi:hypothetical protein